MRIGLLIDHKGEFPIHEGRPEDLDSELAAIWEVDELQSGLADAGFDVVLVGDTRRLLNRAGYWRNRLDIIFNRIVGTSGVARHAIAPAVLEASGIAYIGSDPYAQAIVQHKVHSKLVVAQAGIRTPSFAMFTDPPFRPTTCADVTFPAIVKLVAESSSIGITEESVANDAHEAITMVEYLHVQYNQPVLVEHFISGAEVEVPLLVDGRPRALGVARIAAGGPDSFLTSSTIYNDQYEFEDIPEAPWRQPLLEAAEAAAHALGIRDYGRIDFRVDSNGCGWFIEAETMPHLQRHSSFQFLAARSGREYHEMLSSIVDAALARLRLTR